MTKEEKLRRDRGFEISHFEPQTEPHRSRGVTCKFVEEGKVSAEIINYIATMEETIDKGMTIFTNEKNRYSLKFQFILRFDEKQYDARELAQTPLGFLIHAEFSIQV